MLYRPRLRRLSAIALLACFGCSPAALAQPAMRPLSPAVPGVRAPVSQENPYLIGPADQLKVDVFEAPEYSAGVTVLGDGSITLPRLGRLKVEGLSLEGLQQVIVRQLDRYLQKPIVTVSLAAARPLRISVTGEIQRPGPYSLNVGETNKLTGTTNVTQPTLTDAITKAGGIRQFADIRNIQVRRRQIDGSVATLTVNLWQLIAEGRLSQDLIMADGDEVLVPTVERLVDTEALTIGSSNISPATISVNVVGEVGRPGSVSVPANTPLNQAIVAAGGFNNRANNRTVDLIRLNPDGTVLKQAIAADFSKGIESAQNPPLRNGDSVVVYPSTFTYFTDGLTQVLGPITPLAALLGIFGVRF